MLTFTSIKKYCVIYFVENKNKEKTSIVNFKTNSLFFFLFINTSYFVGLIDASVIFS